MKKILSTLLAASLMLLGTQAFAQGSINAGYLNSTQSRENGKGINSNGVYVGASYNIGIVGGLGIAPGIYYSLIANRSSETGAILGITGTSDVRFREHAINVPVYLNWGTDLARDSRFFVFAGPTVQYGLSSTLKSKGSITIPGIGSLSDDSSFNYYDNAIAEQNRFNVYLGGGVGITVAGIQVTVGYDYGMMNLYEDDDDPKSHRSNIKIGVGFAF